MKGKPILKVGAWVIFGSAVIIAVSLYLVPPPYTNLLTFPLSGMLGIGIFFKYKDELFD